MKEVDFTNFDDRVMVTLTESQLQLLLTATHGLHREAENGGVGWGVAEQDLLDSLNEFFGEEGELG